MKRAYILFFTGALLCPALSVNAGIPPLPRNVATVLLSPAKIPSLARVTQLGKNLLPDYLAVKQTPAVTLSNGITSRILMGEISLENLTPKETDSFFAYALPLQLATGTVVPSTLQIDQAATHYKEELARLAPQKMTPLLFCTLAHTITNLGLMGSPSDASTLLKIVKKDFGNFTPYIDLFATRALLNLEGYKELKELAEHRLASPVLNLSAVWPGVQEILSEQGIELDIPQERVFSMKEMPINKLVQPLFAQHPYSYLLTNESVEMTRAWQLFRQELDGKLNQAGLQLHAAQSVTRHLEALSKAGKQLALDFPDAPITPVQKPARPAVAKTPAKTPAQPAPAETPVEEPAPVETQAAVAAQPAQTATPAQPALTVREKQDVLNRLDELLELIPYSSSGDSPDSMAFAGLKNMVRFWSALPQQCPEEYAVYFKNLLAEIEKRGLGKQKNKEEIAPDQVVKYNSFNRLIYRGKDARQVLPGDFVLDEELSKGVPNLSLVPSEHITFVRETHHSLVEIKLGRDVTPLEFQAFIENVRADIDTFYNHTGTVEVRFGNHELGLPFGDDKISGDRFWRGALHIHFEYSNQVSQVTMVLNIDASQLELQAIQDANAFFRRTGAPLNKWEKKSTYVDYIWLAYRRIFSNYFPHRLKTTLPDALRILKDQER